MDEPLQLNPRQEESLGEADARINIWHGSVRSGKSFAKLLAFAGAIAEREKKRGDYVLIAKTMRTLRRNTINPLTDLLGTRAVNIKWGDGVGTILGQPVELITANDERAEQKVRGGTFELVSGDELTLWPESLFRMVLSRMSIEGAQFFGDTNPDNPFHYLKTDFIDRAGDLDLKAFHFKLRDNLALPATYVSALEKEYTGLWKKRFIDGLWVLAEGVIWDMFDSDEHACQVKAPDDAEFVRYFVGIDYGTSNPFVALLIGQTTDDKFYVLDEWRWDSKVKGHQLTDAKYSEKVGEWIKRHEVQPSAFYVDPSAASMRLQLAQDHAWNVIEADNDVDSGLRTVAKLFAADKLHILQHCAGLVGEISSYSWDPKKVEKGQDVPLKKADHGPDALRYALHTFLKYRIGDLDQYGWVA